MKNTSRTWRIINIVLTSILFIALVAFAGFITHRYQQGRILLSETVATSQATEQDLHTQLAALGNKNDDLSDKLHDAENRNQKFESQIEEITSQVGSLTKLSQTDPELLRKYSKIYFLNENYTPSGLTDIDSRFIYNKTKNLEIHIKVWSFFRDMLEDARDDDVDIDVASAFRSFGTQAGLKSQYNVIYGAGTANQFSAEQGYSEHQLGTAVDLTTPSLKGAIDGFDKTDAYTWMTENAYKYGFILSYPKGNTYYEYEPWHWRFVGTDLARKLHKNNKNFYDLDQREIDTYLVDIFD